MNSVLILPCKFTLWIPHLSALHAAKGKQILLLSMKSSLASPAAGGSALSMVLVLDPKVWWIWDQVQVYVLKTPISQPAWQSFRVTDPHELLALSLQRHRQHKPSLCSPPGLSTLSTAALHFGPCLLHYCSWAVQDVLRQTQHKKTVISETAAGLAQLQHGPQAGLGSGSPSPSLVMWAWVSNTSSKFSITTAHGGDTFTTRIWLCSCKHLCCKIWLKDKWLCGLSHLAGWAHTPAFGGAFAWIEGFFSDPVTAPGLARLTSGFLGMSEGRAELWSIST